MKAAKTIPAGLPFATATYCCPGYGIGQRLALSCPADTHWQIRRAVLFSDRMKHLMLLLILALGLATARAQIYLDDAELWLSRTRARLQLEDLQNFGTNVTGQLRVVLYATEEEWHDTHHRKAVASFAVARLQPGEIRHRIRKTVRLSRPHWGWYWLTVTVQERALDETGKYRWFTRDHLEFDDPVYFAPRLHQFFWPF